MGLTEARVSQIMCGNGKNLQARTIARIAFHLGVHPTIEFKDEVACSRSDEPPRTKGMTRQIKQWLAVTKDQPEWNGPSNDDDGDIEFEKREREAA
jgi:transcriptional regulator with XRE-family HTH domain